MAVTITGKYTGNLKTELTHPSGTKIITAAPVDNKGDGSSFSPTDLAAASLPACMVTTMAIFSERNGNEVDLSGVTFEVTKEMSNDPRRIGRLPVVIHMPKNLTPELRAKYERVAHSCPIDRSLHPDVKIEATFVYDVERAG